MIPHEITVRLIPREDGGLRICSDDVPGLILSSTDLDEIMLDLLPAAEDLMRHNGSMPRTEVRLPRSDVLALRQLLGIVRDIIKAKEENPLISRIDAALSNS